MSTLYRTKVTAVGGRAGSVRSDDGLLQMQLALPPGLGGRGGAPNPEQLFGAGYSACFGNAILSVARMRRLAVRDDAVEVTATIGLQQDGSGSFMLTTTLDVVIAELDEATANDLAQAAHHICPYSNAVRGNVDVVINVSVRPAQVT